MRTIQKGFVGGIVVVSVLATFGCAPTAESDVEPALSYAEAVTIYNQELAALHTLQQQRQSLQQQIDMPSLGGVSDLLESAGKLQGELGETLDELSNPTGKANAKPKATDQVDTPDNGEASADTAGREANKAADPLEQLSAEIKAVGEKQNAKVAEIEAQIADLDQQIVEQQARVDRAKADRDAADAAR
jgi:DNA repair exonuclease SbcCD ATPase subunit